MATLNSRKLKVPCYMYKAYLCKDWKSRDRTENSNFLLFHHEEPFGELFSEVLLKLEGVQIFLKSRKVRNTGQSRKNGR